MDLLIFAAAASLVKPTATLLADVLATAIAAYYIWQSARVNRRLLVVDRGLAGRSGQADECTARARRRLLALGLSNSVRMTVHFSLFPTATLRASYILRGLLGCA